MRTLLFRRPAAATTVMALVIMGLAIGQTADRASAVDDSIGAPPDWVVKSALAVAAANGDVSPASVQYTVSTPACIAAVTDDVSSDTETQLCVVLMRGDFTLYTAHLPVGIEPSAADWVMLVFDPLDQTVAGMAAARGDPDISALGSMTELASGEK